MASMKNALPALLILGLIGIMAVAAASMFAFNNDGAVATTEVTGYLDEGSTILLETLTWDPILPGGSDTQLIYVNSTGTVPAVLNLTTADWNPTYAEPLVTYTWDLEGDTIQPNELLVANITLTLAVDMGNVTTFDFTAIINAEET